jgi:hypothetical protein
LSVEWEDEPKLIKVVWDDITDLSSWQSRDSMEDHWNEDNPQRCVSVGFLIGTQEEDGGAILVAARKGRFTKEDDAWGLVQRIPKGVVVSMVNLKECK